MLASRIEFAVSLTIEVCEVDVRRGEATHVELAWPDAGGPRQPPTTAITGEELGKGSDAAT